MAYNEASIGLKVDVDQRDLDRLITRVPEFGEVVKATARAVDLAGRDLGDKFRTFREIAQGGDPRAIRQAGREAAKATEENYREIYRVIAFQTREVDRLYRERHRGILSRLDYGSPGWEAEQARYSRQRADLWEAASGLRTGIGESRGEIDAQRWAMGAGQGTQGMGVWGRAAYSVGAFGRSMLGMYGVPLSIGAAAYGAIRQQQENWSQYAVLRQLARPGDLTPGITFNALRDQILDIPGLSFGEATQVRGRFGLMAGASLGRGPMAAEAGLMGLGFGVGATAGSEFFGGLARLGVTGNVQGQREFAGVLAEAIVQGQMRGREGQVFQDLSTYLQAASQTTLRTDASMARGFLDLQQRLFQAGDTAGVGQAVRGGGAMGALMGMSRAITSTELFPNVGAAMLRPVLAGIAMRYNIRGPAAMQEMVEQGPFGRIGGTGPMLYQELLGSPLMQGDMGALLMHQMFQIPVGMARLLQAGAGGQGRGLAPGFIGALPPGMWENIIASGPSRMTAVTGVLESFQGRAVTPENTKEFVDALQETLAKWPTIEETERSLVEVQKEMNRLLTTLTPAIGTIAHWIEILANRIERLFGGGGGGTNVSEDLLGRVAMLGGGGRPAAPSHGFHVPSLKGGVRDPWYEPWKPSTIGKEIRRFGDWWNYNLGIAIDPLLPESWRSAPGPQGAIVAPSSSEGMAAMANDAYNGQMNAQEAAFAAMSKPASGFVAESVRDETFAGQFANMMLPTGEMLRKYGGLVRQVVAEYGSKGITESMLWATIMAESSGKETAVGDSGQSRGLMQINYGKHPEMRGASLLDQIRFGARTLLEHLGSGPIEAHRRYRGFGSYPNAVARWILQGMFERAYLAPWETRETGMRGGGSYRPGPPTRYQEIAQFGEFTPIQDFYGGAPITMAPIDAPPIPELVYAPWETRETWDRGGRGVRTPPWLSQVGPLGSRGMGFPIVGGPGTAPMPDLFPWETRETWDRGGRGWTGGGMSLDDLARAFRMNISISIDPLSIIIRGADGHVIDTTRVQPRGEWRDVDAVPTHSTVAP